MNGSCAGGTGAFIDQMATLLKMGARRDGRGRPDGATRTYTIASRCGVFAKSDIQPLINQGAQAGDIAASHLSAPSSTRPSRAWPRAAPSRATFCTSAAR